MMMSIIEGDEKIPFWSRVTKPWTQSCAEKSCEIIFAGGQFL